MEEQGWFVAEFNGVSSDLRGDLLARCMISRTRSRSRMRITRPPMATCLWWLTITESTRVWGSIMRQSPKLAKLSLNYSGHKETIPSGKQ
ncbi:hypothetical protein Bca52824_008693 [Brassica carinata]|uniref:Uncharacterized protein n=1 Tax=Brassica carinata TaxID=52824 RepID=A0A8X7WBS2_BRACI|nr:hypothetical protein Bca52824_008693 [Brassica carinata]